MDGTVVAGLACFFIPFAVQRFLDGDEGVYAFVARLVTQGKLPYRDFPYPQMPLLPYAYGAWRNAFGENWISLRLLSALLTVALGYLIYARVRTAGVWLGAASAALFATSKLAFDWMLTVKSYALSTLLLFLAFLATERAKTPRVAALAGVLVGLSIGTRLLLAAAVPVFVGYLIFTRRPLATWFSVGVAVGLVPSAVFFALFPDGFIFDNVEWHAVRSSSGFVGDYGQKARAVANLLGYGSTDHVAGLQFAALIFGAAIGSWTAFRSRGMRPLAGLIAVAIGAASLVPTPLYTQYFCTLVPFLVVAAFPVRVNWTRASTAIGLVFVMTYIVAGSVDYAYRLTSTINADERVSTVERVARAIDRTTFPGERVLTSWPGYLIGTHATAVQGFEEHFAPQAAASLAPTRARHLHFLTPAAVERAIEAHASHVAVFRTWATPDPKPDWPRALAKGRYRAIAHVGGATIYRWP